MVVENKFNLIDEAWVPIEEIGLVSLKQIFSNPEYRALSGTPIQKIALTKFLLAIAQASYTPSDNNDWYALGSDGLAEKCLTYLSKWHEKFWLFGKQPFLQMPEIKKAKVKSFGSVMPEIATGNTTLLLESQVEPVLQNADLALLVITLMGCALGGKKTDNRINLSKGYKKGASGKPGTFISRKGLMHSFLLGEFFLDTLWFNLLTCEDIKQIGNYTSELGVAPWEKMPEGEDCSTAKVLKSSLLGRLVPLSKFILISGNGLHYSDGIEHLGYKDGGIDPSATIDHSAKEARALWTDPEKRPWRHLSALLSFISQGNTNMTNCYQIKFGLSRVRESVDFIGIWSGGMKVSNNAGEQYATGRDNFVESTVMLQSSWLGELWYEQLKVELSELEDLSSTVSKKTASYFNSLGMKEQASAQAKKATYLFWELCEKYFQELINSCTDADQLKKMRGKFARHAMNTFDGVCFRETARQLDAWAKNRPNLHKYLS